MIKFVFTRLMWPAHQRTHQLKSFRQAMEKLKQVQNSRQLWLITGFAQFVNWRKFKTPEVREYLIKISVFLMNI